ncbi:vomeronasal type-2 receptor 26-like [Xenopus laevis]|uniref:Vomeronasal type-2 receptor 26-like n=1 Tax=Xenopus laevis TaxID=8355 RepID=A0A8J1LN71_XENLA|nr:vomeronasal type-2 receptor 26-like [Xenopus laevis]
MTLMFQVEFDFERKPNNTCRLINIRNYQNLLAFVYAITEINKNPKLLPNTTLGFHVVDPCLTEEKAMTGMIDIFSGKGVPTPNYRCGHSPKLVAFVDGISSKVTLLIARVFGIYKIPQISYAAMDPVLSIINQFPYFYRTVPNEIAQYDALVKLIRYFSWTWVGVLVSDNESGLIMSQMLQKEFALNGICFAFLEFIPYHDGLDYTKKLQIARCLSHSAANVIISYGDRDHMLTLHLILYEFPISEKVWIISFQWDVASGFDYYFLRYDPFNGSLAFSLHASSIPGFEDFLLALTPDDFPNDIFIYYAWWEMYSCVWKTNKTFIKCNGTEKMQKEYENVYKDLSFYSYSIYNAVNTLVYTLHYLQLQKRKEAHDIEAWEMHKYIKKITITDGDGNEVHFDENGDMPSDFDILNWIVYPNQTLDGIRVGTYVQRSSFPELRINESLIRWSPTFNGTPHSTCSETCHIGYKKKPKVGFVACCYDCVSCPEGEISNQTGGESCLKCLLNQWPNSNRNICLDKAITYLSYNEPLGGSLAFLSVLFFIMTCLVLMIFIKYRHTPVVKANNQHLSYILLVSLKISFLCNLMFIRHPLQVTCILRQTVFGVTFSIVISSVLAKTVTVVIAFNATRPGSKLRNYVGTRVSNSIVIFCSLMQMIICTSWLVFSPPFPYYNMEDVIGVIVAECHEHPSYEFYCILGFMGLLAVINFIIAFFARTLPDIFNEAKFITFSMLLFCSVWISFIPAYLSAKGKYVVAAEIFAILASSSGILGCIFIPKCNIILFRADKNTKNFITKN